VIPESVADRQWRRTRLVLAILLFAFSIPNALIVIVALGPFPPSGGPIPGWAVDLSLGNAVVTLGLGAYVVRSLAQGSGGRALEEIDAGH
jgi:hypothetical protein